MKYSIVLSPFACAKRFFRSCLDIYFYPLKTYALTIIWRMSCGRGVRFWGPTIIRAYDRGAIVLGDNVKFMAVQNRNVVGLTNPTILCANKGAKIIIGDYTGLSAPVINARSRIEIGRYVNVGGNVRIFDNDFHALEWQDRRPPQGGKIRTKPVIIEDDCFIGTNAIILKGTHLGARSIVAAGSVVFGLEIPPDSMVKGNPARIYKR